MASRLMSAYGNLASAKTDIGRNLSDIAGIGIEMEYGPEGSIARQMAIEKIKKQTEAIGLGLESIQQFASMGVSAGKEAARAKEMGELAGTGSVQTKGETKLWDLFRGKADIDTAGGETFWGEVGERIGTGLGFMDREYKIGKGTYTSSQIEAGSPWAKLGKDWKEVSQLMGGGKEIVQSTTDIFEPVSAAEQRRLNPLNPVINPPSGRERQITPYRPQEGMFEGSRRYDKSGKVDPMTGEPFATTSTPVTTSKYSDMTFSQYLKDPSVDQDLVNRLMSGGWSSAIEQWKELRKTL